MKNNKTKFLTVIMLMLITSFLIFAVTAQIKSINFIEPNNDLQLNISSAKGSYVLGETVLLDFEIKNNSSTDIRAKGIDLDSNYISLFIAYEGEPYKQYKHSRIRETGGLIKAGQSVKSRSGILWNSSPLETSSRGKEEGDKQILSFYAFSKAGVYSLKADFGYYIKEGRITVESKPIQIIIDEPVGDDLEVWNTIKDSQDIGFFIQENYFRTSNPQKKEKLMQEVEQLTLKHPNSLLASQVGKSLEKLKAYEEERKAYLEKIKKQQ